jgi:hypothetical protein
MFLFSVDRARHFRSRMQHQAPISSLRTSPIKASGERRPDRAEPLINLRLCALNVMVNRLQGLFRCHGAAWRYNLLNQFPIDKSKRCARKTIEAAA